MLDRQGDFWAEHEEFLKQARIKDVFVKAVIIADTTGKDVAEACNIITRVDRSIPLVLQPATQEAGDRLPDFRRLCEKELETVKIIPQLHKLAGVR